MFEQRALRGGAELLAGGPDVICRVEIPPGAKIVPSSENAPKHVRFERTLSGRAIPYLIVGDGVNELTRPDEYRDIIGALRIFKCGDGTQDRLVVVIDRKARSTETHELVPHANHRMCRGDVRMVETAKVDGHQSLLEIRVVIGYKQHARLRRRAAA